MKGRETVAYINIDKYLENLNYIQNQAKTNIMPVLKANAYGHGMVPLAKQIFNEGYTMLAVAYLEEALQILKEGIKLPILIFNYFSPTDFKELSEFAQFLRPTITSYMFLEKVCDILGKDVGKFKFHINVDTGINRIGTKEERFPQLIKLIKDKNVRIEGVYSHFASADERDNFTRVQFEKYKTLLDYIINSGIDVEIKHISNSAAALFFPKYSLDYVRPGIATYGLQPSTTHKIDQLKPILELKSIVASIQNLQPNETIGYGRTYKVQKKMKTAVVPMGYADGYFRVLSNNGEVLINGRRRKILGRVSMDQIVVDVTDNNVSIGDEVVIIGRQKYNEISAEEVAENASTINYEVTSRIAQRVQRIYIKGGKYFE
ncbi:MAG: Alanine racemase [Petrotoga mobilis]|nr:MAG: Alanine racemase [Petrotoga mobilis]